MDIKGWKYYNHAAIPKTAPHEEPDLSPLKDKSIWSMPGKPLLATWTSNFDCGYETNWWELIRSAPFDMEGVSAKERKVVRQALKKSYAKKIDIADYMDELYACYLSAFSQYENADNMKSRDSFIDTTDPRVECWGGFDTETDKLIGYMIVVVYDVHAEIHNSKFDPVFSTSRPSDSLHYTVLNYYLEEQGKQYVSSGSRNINHKTGAQEYKIRRFGYRKAYCHLHIRYNPLVKPIVLMLFPFRKLLSKLDKISLIHQVNAVLFMEELVREGNDLKQKQEQREWALNGLEK